MHLTGLNYYFSSAGKPLEYLKQADYIWVLKAYCGCEVYSANSN
jgi:hypothetical protein